jgi:biopolymer transport protein ExbB/TolQ
LFSGRNNPLNISKRDKKILTVGALAVVLIFVVNYVIVPFTESEMDIRERTQQKEMLLQKYEKIMNQRDKVEKELSQLRGKQNKLKKRLLKGSTPSLAAAEMQKVLEKISR